MKFSPILSLISAVIAALLAYLMNYIAGDGQHAMLCTIGSFVCFFSTLMPMMGVSSESERLQANIKVMSTIFMVLFAISNIFFAYKGYDSPLYIILNGILLLIYLAIFYKMQNIKDI